MKILHLSASVLITFVFNISIVYFSRGLTRKWLEITEMLLSSTIRKIYIQFEPSGIPVQISSKLTKQ